MPSTAPDTSVNPDPKPAWTPGKWALMQNMPTNVLCERGYRVARCDFDGDFDHPECEANAHLIAAAPELYEKLDRLVTEVRASFHIGETEIRLAIGNTNFGIIEQRISEARLALSRARGETP